MTAIKVGDKCSWRGYMFEVVSPEPTAAHAYAVNMLPGSGSCVQRIALSDLTLVESAPAALNSEPGHTMESLDNEREHYRERAVRAETELAAAKREIAQRDQLVAQLNAQCERRDATIAELRAEVRTARASQGSAWATTAAVEQQTSQLQAQLQAALAKSAQRKEALRIVEEAFVDFVIVDNGSLLVQGVRQPVREALSDDAPSAPAKPNIGVAAASHYDDEDVPNDDALILGLRKERDALKAEVERLKAMNEEAYESGRARGQREIMGPLDEARAAFDKVAAENAKLREALQAWVNDYRSSLSVHCDHELLKAAAALGIKPVTP